MGRVVRAQLLTPDAFRPFGTVLQRPARPGDVAREYLDWWGGLYDLDFTETASLGILEIRRQPFTIDALERHVKAVEVFVPMEGVGIMPFAPATDNRDPASAPDLSRLTAFVLDGTQAFVIARGVWHFPPLPFTDRMVFVLTVRKDTADDLDIKPIAPVEVVL